MYSCMPNLEVVSQPDDPDTLGQSGHVLYYTALRPIRRGEELFLAYAHPDIPLAQRRAHLAQFGFQCTCARCLSETQLQVVNP